MKYEQATQIIQHHIEWLRSDKSIEYKYTEEAFNEALSVLLNDCQHAFGYVQDGKCLNCGKTLSKQLKTE